MNKKKKEILYLSITILSVVGFILLVVFDAKGIWGLLLTLLCIYLFIGSIIKQWKLGNKNKNSILAFLDLLFWLP